MMFNDKTQAIYFKYLQLFEDFANEYADELPERTKVKFQKSLVKYYDAELAEAIKHEQFVLKAKNDLFRRAMKAQRKIARFPSITEQEVNKALQALGLRQDVTTQIVRLMVLGLSAQEDPTDEEPPEVPFVADIQQEDPQDDDGDVVVVEPPVEVVSEVPPTEVVVDTPPVLDEDPQDETTTAEQKGSYWTTRRKNRRKTDESTGT